MDRLRQENNKFNTLFFNILSGKKKFKKIEEVSVFLRNLVGNITCRA
jgi:hypothetical protein